MIEHLQKIDIDVFFDKVLDFGGINENANIFLLTPSAFIARSVFSRLAEKVLSGQRAQDCAFLGAKLHSPQCKLSFCNGSILHITNYIDHIRGFEISLAGIGVFEGTNYEEVDRLIIPYLLPRFKSIQSVDIKEKLFRVSI